MWLKNALKITLVLSLTVGVPAFAKKQTKAPISKKVAILATSYLIKDIDTGEIIAEQNSKEIRSIASITKLMSAVVVLDSGTNLNEMLDVYPIKGIGSKLQKTKMSRSDLLTLSLMSSDNLAAKTLAINHPGGENAHIAAMNKKAEQLGMTWSKFVDPTGLYDENVSTGEDLAKLISTAENYQLIKTASTSLQKRIEMPAKKKSRYIDFHTTNHLISKMPEIVLSKTGWIRKSGGCLVMSIHRHGRRLAVILLNSKNTQTRFRDAELLYGLQHGKNI
jgi:serine-type D-Ala-D-Ala endopeptidase (penicillin-binding protein 7)